MKRAFTIGTDPEFFMREKETKKFISSVPHIKGTKHDPEKLPCGAGLQKDNVAVEFASVPADSEAALVQSVRSAFMDIMTKLPEGHELVAVPSACFEDDQLRDEEALEFGCDPDYDAYERSMNSTPFCEDYTFRSCGGHIHLGHVKGQPYEFLLDPYGKLDTVLMMDAVLGTVSVVLDSSEDSVKRRELYGKAGCHRPTDYGVEYRVLSNFWLKSPQLVMLMYRLSADVLRIMEEHDYKAFLDDVGTDNIKEIINDGNVKEAISIVEQKVKPMLSGETKELLNECLLAGGTEQNLNKEWELEV